MSYIKLTWYRDCFLANYFPSKLTRISFFQSLKLLNNNYKFNYIYMCGLLFCELLSSVAGTLDAFGSMNSVNYPSQVCIKFFFTYFCLLILKFILPTFHLTIYQVFLITMFYLMMMTTFQLVGIFFSSNEIGQFV